MCTSTSIYEKGQIFLLDDKEGRKNGVETSHNYLILSENEGNGRRVQCMTFTTMTNREYDGAIPVMLTNGMISYLLPFNIYGFNREDFKLHNYHGTLKNDIISKSSFMKLALNMYMSHNGFISESASIDVTRNYQDYLDNFWKKYSRNDERRIKLSTHHSIATRKINNSIVTKSSKNKNDEKVYEIKQKDAIIKFEPSSSQEKILSSDKPSGWDEIYESWFNKEISLGEATRKLGITYAYFYELAKDMTQDNNETDSITGEKSNVTDKKRKLSKDERDAIILDYVGENISMTGLSVKYKCSLSAIQRVIKKFNDENRNSIDGGTAMTESTKINMKKLTKPVKSWTDTDLRNYTDLVKLYGGEYISELFKIQQYKVRGITSAVMRETMSRSL